MHVPFCATRCGYCDFNTYTAGELGSAASPQSWLDAALAEIDLAAKCWATGDRRGLDGVRGRRHPVAGRRRAADPDPRRDRRPFGLADDVEVTTEANPESTDPALLAALRAGGLHPAVARHAGASPRVLRVLDRVHTPGRALDVVGWARAPGFEHVNLDLIYGTPGETDAEFADSLDAAIAAGVDHVSAYSLIVEPGTRLARQVARGELPMPDEDVLADRYLLADRLLTAAGLRLVRGVQLGAPRRRRACRHNLAYWSGGDWWGIGPGAHSHVGGVRWWNVKHPAAYAQRLAAGRSPGHAREILGDDARHLEDVLLRLRLAGGCRWTCSPRPGPRGARAAADGRLDDAELANGRAVLTLRGRLLADGIALSLAGLMGVRSGCPPGRRRAARRVVGGRARVQVEHPDVDDGPLLQRRAQRPVQPVLQVQLAPATAPRAGTGRRRRWTPRPATRPAAAHAWW